MCICNYRACPNWNLAALARAVGLRVKLPRCERGCSCGCTVSNLSTNYCEGMSVVWSNSGAVMAG